MSNDPLVSLDPFLTELFLLARQAGMALTLKQYERLRQAVAKGYGLGGWEDLEQICQLLWVKPSPHYQAQHLEQAFAELRRQYPYEPPTSTQQSSPQPGKETLGPLPQIPPRRKPAREATGEKIAPVAVKTTVPALPLSPKGKTGFQVLPTDFPLQFRDVQTSWRLLRKLAHRSGDKELDLDATIRQIEREGIFSDVILRPAQTQSLELVLLIDDSHVMVPFRPALDPLLQAITEHRIKPAQTYTFTIFPKEFLYQRKPPSLATPLSLLLPRWHQDRTIALIWSDAGAVSGQHSQEQVKGISNFLRRLIPCTQQVLWLNPLPPQRWQGTTAQAINTLLKHQMLTLEPDSLRVLVQNQTAR